MFPTCPAAFSPPLTPVPALRSSLSISSNVASPATSTLIPVLTYCSTFPSIRMLLTPPPSLQIPRSHDDVPYFPVWFPVM